MRLALLLLVLFALPAIFFGKDEISRHYVNSIISESPAYTEGSLYDIDDGVIDDRYRYKYQVNNNDYYVLSTPQIITKSSMLENSTKEIAYSSSDPSISTLRVYYDKRHETGTLGQSIVVVSVLSFGIALPIWLVLMLLLWLSRKINKKTD